MCSVKILLMLVTRSLNLLYKMESGRILSSLSFSNSVSKEEIQQGK